MKLLEREPLLGELELALQSVTEGAGRLVLLAGEAGVGKSALARTFLEGVGGRADVAVGACDPLSTPRPLGPLLDVAPAFGGEVAVALREGGDREAILRALVDSLRVRTRPLVLVLEDVHWGDEATLDLLQFLGRRVAAFPVLLIASYRDDELGRDHPLRRLLGNLATVRAVARLRVEPLSERAVEVLAAGSGRVPAELWRRTGGNPFFITEILATDGKSVPDTVRDAVLARAAKLSPAGRRVLDAASVIGARVDPWFLKEVLGGDMLGVDETVELGMIVNAGPFLSFHHDLAREAVYASVLPGTRAALHRTALTALLASADGVRADGHARLAHHAEGAGDALAVLRFAPAAGRHAARFKAHREAAAQYARALRFAGSQSDRERAELLDAMAYERYLTSDIDGALRARREALELWRSEGDTGKAGDDQRWLSRLWWFAGRRKDAVWAGREAVSLLARQAPSLELAWAYSNLSQLAMLEEDVTEAMRWGEEAMQVAEAFGSAEIRSHVLNNMGTVLYMAGRDGGRERLVEALQLARQNGLEEHVARAYTNLASGAVRLRDLDRGDADLSEGLAYCLDHDLDSWRLYMLGWHAVVLLYRGRWNEASGTVAEVLSHRTLPAVSRFQPLVVLGTIRARRGDPDVEAVLEEAATLAAEMGEQQRLGPVAAGQAEAAWLRGGASHDLDLLERVYQQALDRGDAWTAGETGYWRWKLTGANLPPDRIASPFAAQVAGRWREAATAWSELGFPYEEARALAEGDSQDSLHRAYQIFEGLEARAAMDQVIQRLRALGLQGPPTGPRSSTRANPGQLTRRQMEVLELLAEGLSDAEIAAKLHRSVRTVGHHVSAVLAKLDVENRTQAVRTAFERGYLRVPLGGDGSAEH